MSPRETLPVVGLIPAAGAAARLAPLPSSKELVPVGFYQAADGPRPRPVCLYLLERMALAGVGRAFIVLRPGKWDIPAYLGDGAGLGLRLAYLTVHVPYGSPYTLDQAHPFLGESLVALGLPDVIFEPADAYARLIARLRAGNAAAVLGLFPAERPQSCDMVAADPDGRVRRIEIKPARSEPGLTWMIAVWTPQFSDFLHELLRSGPDLGRELFIGDVFQAAIDAGLLIDSLAFPEGYATDVGTPESLAAAVRRYSAPGEAGGQRRT